MRYGTIAVLAMLIGTPLYADGLWISREEIAPLPMSGPAWDQMKKAASLSTVTLKLSDQNNNAEQYVLARALVYARTGEEKYRTEVEAACMKAIGTEQGGRTLALGRNLAALVVAADIVGLSEANNEAFRAWLRSLLTMDLDGRTLVSTHEQRPNNWGTMAGASRAAIAVYLKDTAELERTALVFRGYLGHRPSYAKFKFGELDWQSDPDNPVGINPLNAVISGYLVDGFLPDDLRRGGGFQIPPAKTGYPCEALQGAYTQAEILHRAGYPVYEWENQALLRAARGLERLEWFAEGDDQWLPWLINYRYGTTAGNKLVSPARHGKIMGWTDWTHGPGRSDSTPPPDDPPPPSVGTLVLSPTSVNVNYEIDGDVPEPESVNLSSTSVLSFTAAASHPWVSVSAASGVTPATVQISIDPTGLAVGSHNANVMFTTVNGPQMLPVSLTITDGTPPPPPPPCDPPPPAPTGSISVAIAAGTDDVEWRASDSKLVAPGGDLVFGSENKSVFLRFVNVEIPQGAVITGAYLECQVNAASNDATDLKIQVQDIGNAPPVTKADVAARIKSTDPFVPWKLDDSDSDAWTDEDVRAKSFKASPDFRALVQRVVNRTDWKSGQSMMIAVSGIGHREVNSFESDGRDPIRLRVEFSK